MFGISDIHVERKERQSSDSWRKSLVHIVELQPPYISMNTMLLESWNLERVPELPDILDEWMGSM